MNLDTKLKRFEFDLTTVFHDLQEYKKIFTGTDLYQKVLNDSAPNFFITLQRYFWNNTILSITRLLETSKGGKNLTIDVLLLIAKRMNLACEFDLKKNIEEIRGDILKLRKWRNKIIAHRDLKYSLRENYEEIAIKLDDVEGILGKIGECVNIIARETRNATISWQVVTHESAESLMRILINGLIYIDIKKKRGNWVLDKQEKEESNYHEV